MSQIREEAMEDFISRYERQLLAARPRRLRLRKPITLGVIGIALVAGTATAAMAPWTPTSERAIRGSSTSRDRPRPNPNSRRWRFCAARKRR
jgi:hypothetical protein